MTAVIYTRVSDEEQLRGASLDVQEETCRAYALQQEAKVLRVFSDRAETAKTSDRPAFKALMLFCQAERVDLVLVYKLDRFARRSYDHTVFSALLQTYGARLVSVTEPTADDPAGRLLTTILSGIAQFDNEVKGERVKASMRSLAQRGAWLHAAPFGFRPARINGIPALAPHPTYAPIVSEALLGVKDSRRTVSATREFLASLGVTPDPWTVNRMLRQPAYAGIVRSALTDWQDVKGVFAGLIELGEWQELQALLDGCRRRQTPRTAEDFPLRGLFCCPVCSKPVTGSASVGASRNRHAYYHCHGGGCRTWRRPTAVIHAAWDRYLDTLNPTVRPALDCLRRGLRRSADRIRLETEQSRKAQQKAVDHLERQKTRLLDGYLEGLIEPVVYKTKAAEIAQTLDSARAALRSADDEFVLCERAIDIVAERFTDLRALWSGLVADVRAEFFSAMFRGPLPYTDAEGFRTPANDCLAASFTDLSGSNRGWYPGRGEIRTAVEGLTRLAGILRAA